MSDDNVLKVRAHFPIHVKLFSDSRTGVKRYQFVREIFFADARDAVEPTMYMYRNSRADRILLIRPIPPPLEIALVVTPTDDGVHFDAVIPGGNGRLVHRDTIDAFNRLSVEMVDVKQVGGTISFKEFAADTQRQAQDQELCSPQQKVHIHTPFQRIVKSHSPLLTAVWNQTDRSWRGYVLTKCQHKKMCRALDEGRELMTSPLKRIRREV